MVIFNSYVKLPEGKYNYNLLQSALSDEFSKSQSSVIHEMIDNRLVFEVVISHILHYGQT